MRAEHRGNGHVLTAQGIVNPNRFWMTANQLPPNGIRNRMLFSGWPDDICNQADIEEELEDDEEDDLEP